MTQNQNLKCSSTKNALHCIAEKAKGEAITCDSINDALDCIAEHVDCLLGSDVKLHLYAWKDSGDNVAYTEKENAVVRDVVIYNDVAYRITQSQTGQIGFNVEGQSVYFSRYAEGDKDETITTIETSKLALENGSYLAANGKAFKAVVVDVDDYMIEKTITENGVYTPPEAYQGFSKVTVNVVEELENDQIKYKGEIYQKVN